MRTKKIKAIIEHTRSLIMIGIEPDNFVDMLKNGFEGYNNVKDLWIDNAYKKLPKSYRKV